MVSVSSSAIARLDYDEEEEVLSITFTDGRSYQLQNFPAIEYHRFVTADSIGAYWNAYVRGNY